MKNYLSRLTGKEGLAFTLIFVCAAFFYLFNIGFSDLWSDEIYTKSMLEGSLADFYAKFRNDLHPPLYYLGLRLFTALFGITPVTLRLFSVLGVLSTLLLGYCSGQRVFGKQGALYFCLMLVSVPMLAVFAHQARMYTWAAFSVTGVWMYSYLYLRTGKKSDLAWLFVFTVMAIYIHYYSLVAALVANLFVFFTLLLTNNKKWIHHLISLLLAALLFLPWLSMFMIQLKRVQQAFWAPDVSAQTVFYCIAVPFTEQFWTTGYSKFFVGLNYTLIIFTLYKSFGKSMAEYRLALWLSVSVFLGTLLAVAVISLFSRPVLFHRYVVTIVVMLIVPLTILFIWLRIKWLKIMLVSVIVLLGIRISYGAYGFSYGPYKQTIGYITATYPEIRKVLHITEVTAGPLIEYNGNSGLSHYWLKAEMSNVDAFPGIRQYRQPGEFLQPGEVFCAVRFHDLVLNMENLERVLSESELVKIDTVRDNKVKDGIFIQVYLLKYTGRSGIAE